MTESRTTGLSNVIGTYAICNTGAVLVYEIDYGGDRVLAGINDQPPEWCGINEGYVDGIEEPGFSLGSFFVPFSLVERFYGNDSGGGG